MTRILVLAGAAWLASGGAATAQNTPPTTDSPSASGAQTPPDTGMAKPDNGMARPDAATTSPGSDSSATGTAAAPDSATTAPAAQNMATQAAPGGAPAPGATAPSDAVQKDWAKYDPKNTGSLTPLSFGTWLMASRGQDMTAQVMKSQTSKQKNLPAVKVLNATASDFAKADTDHDHKISPAEMTAYLSS